MKSGPSRVILSFYVFEHIFWFLSEAPLFFFSSLRVPQSL